MISQYFSGCEVKVTGISLARCSLLSTVESTNRLSDTKSAGESRCGSNLSVRISNYPCRSSRWRLDSFPARFRFARLGCLAAQIALLSSVCFHSTGSAGGCALRSRSFLSIAFRRPDARQQSRSFALGINRLKHSPNSKENERISIRPFLLWHFSLGDKIENARRNFSRSVGLSMSSLSFIIAAGMDGLFELV